jgi:predicted anti-sigma-YlaC factor YlaD
MRPVPVARGPAQVPVPLPRRFSLHRWLRFGLAWIGVLLVGWNLVPMLTAGSGGAVHLERHQAAFSVALGVAFLFVSWRPDRAYGMVPFAVTFAGALAAAAIIDLFHGTSTLPRESRHIAEIAGLGVLWVLGAAAGPARPGKKRPGVPAR